MKDEVPRSGAKLHFSLQPSAFSLHPLAFSLSAHQPIDQGDLANANGEDQSPKQCFAKSESSLISFPKPELQFHCTDLDEVTVAQDGVFNRLMVSDDESVRSGFEDETCCRIEADLEVLIPHAVFFKLQIAVRGTSDAYRETAGRPSGARRFSGQYSQLDHQKIRRFTTILSAG